MEAGDQWGHLRLVGQRRHMATAYSPQHRNLAAVGAPLPPQHLHRPKANPRRAPLRLGEKVEVEQLQVLMLHPDAAEKQEAEGRSQQRVQRLRLHKKRLLVASHSSRRHES